ncbi:hypothetical protein HQN89_15510 [Paenibacillus frigoriresistens]|uniref:hypothetical protein n=1 Tax=Paenibacillus alginolyticus TaxID=59839 RepID=UPI001565B902|nr:hypothetical protein [Paenibacillus frigoriresistens]NRF92415.1 hypothetical protein [Paenibacillus frigoriresistens]
MAIIVAAKKEPAKNAPVKKEAAKKEQVKKEAVRKEQVKKEAVKKEPVKIEAAKKEKVIKETKKEKVIKETTKREVVNPRNLFEMQETETENRYIMRSPSTREGRNGVTRVSREEINDKINEAIDVLGTSKRNVSSDKLRRADEEIDRALRILIKAQREINSRRNWYISE